MFMFDEGPSLLNCMTGFDKDAVVKGIVQYFTLNATLCYVFCVRLSTNWWLSEFFLFFFLLGKIAPVSLGIHRGWGHNTLYTQNGYIGQWMHTGLFYLFAVAKILPVYCSTGVWLLSVRNCLLCISSLSLLAFQNILMMMEVWENECVFAEIWPDLYTWVLRSC